MPLIGSALLTSSSLFHRLKVRPQSLRNATDIEPTASLFGKQYVSPMAIAPSAMQCLAHPDGELATARAARSQEGIMTLSIFSITSLEKVITEG